MLYHTLGLNCLIHVRIPWLSHPMARLPWSFRAVHFSPSYTPAGDDPLSSRNFIVNHCVYFDMTCELRCRNGNIFAVLSFLAFLSRFACCGHLLSKSLALPYILVDTIKANLLVRCITSTDVYFHVYLNDNSIRYVFMVTDYLN